MDRLKHFLFALELYEKKVVDVLVYKSDFNTNFCFLFISILYDQQITDFLFEILNGMKKPLNYKRKKC